ncbi:MAG TPA: hypothetical protein VNB24_00375 [Acidimicrobiales bacterium]|nr:hypothetical protein [Acidimicrobiales bacterium]
MSSTTKARQRRARTANARSGSITRRPARASTGARLRYRFDNAMSRGPMVVIAYLALLSVLIMVVTAVVAVAADLSFAGGNSDGFAESLWQAMLRTIDAGSFAGDTAWPTRLVALLVTLVGLFLAGSLIGLIANAVDQKVEELRRGRSAVIEDGHTLILGWSDQVPRIVNELVIAKESERSASIVVMARADKSEMEETLRDRVEDLKTTRIVCRHGNPSSPADLDRAAVRQARSIVIVRDTDGDAGVVKAVLAVHAVAPELSNAHIVAELSESDNARIIRATTGGSVLTVSSDQVVAEVTAQACLQAGLSTIFTDLLDFGGDEIYFVPAGELSGRPYRDAVLGFEHSSVIGRIGGDGLVELNPAPLTTIAPDDELILIAEDDSAIRFSGLTEFSAPESNAGSTNGSAPSVPMHLAIVGWSSFGERVLRELDEFLPDRSRVDILVDHDLVAPGELEALALEHGTLAVHGGDGGPDDFRQLLASGTPQQVIVLGYRDVLSVDDADARTLLTLLALRSQWPVGGSHGVRIVAELLDQQNLALAAPVGVDDLIVSNALSSLLMAQLSERAELQTVFDDLFDADGAVVEMRRADSLVGPQSLPFGVVVAAAAAHGASAFGYRLGATGEVAVNPPKSRVVSLGADDHVAVVATSPV